MSEFDKARRALDEAEAACIAAQTKLRAMRDSSEGGNRTKMRFITEALDEAGLHLGAAVLHLRTVRH